MDALGHAPTTGENGVLGIHGALQIRRLYREDIPAAALVATAAFGSEAIGALVRRMLTVQCDTVGPVPLDEQTEVLLAAEYYALCDGPAGALIGLSGLYRTVWTDPSVYSLGWFCVSPALQRKGLGGLLLKATMTIAVSLGGRRMVIETSPEAEAALHLYRRLGFEECGRVPDYFAPGVPLVLLSRSLETPSFDAPEGLSYVV